MPIQVYFLFHFEIRATFRNLRGLHFPVQEVETPPYPPELLTVGAVAFDYYYCFLFNKAHAGITRVYWSRPKV